MYKRHSNDEAVDVRITSVQLPEDSMKSIGKLVFWFFAGIIITLVVALSLTRYFFT